MTFRSLQRFKYRKLHSLISSATNTKPTPALRTFSVSESITANKGFLPISNQLTKFCLVIDVIFLVGWNNILNKFNCRRNIRDEVEPTSPKPTKRRNSDIDVRLMEESKKQIEEEKSESTSQLIRDTDTNSGSQKEFLEKHHKVLVDSLSTTIKSPRA